MTQPLSRSLRRLSPALAGLLLLTAPVAQAQRAQSRPAETKPAESLPTAREVLAAATEAGASAEAAQHQNRVQKGTFSVPAQGMSGNFTTYTQPPNKYLNVITMDMIGEMKQGFDGETGWATDALQGPRILGAEELEAIAMESNFESDLSKVFPDSKVLGSDNLEGQDCWKLELGMDSGSKATGWFSKSSKHLVGMQRVVKSPMGELPVMILMGGYQTMNGLTVPTKMTTRMAGMEQVVEINEVLVNVKDLPSFSPPPEVAALKGKGQ